VGTCAYGIDFHTMDDRGGAQGQEGEQLVRASQRIFEAGLLSGSAWGRPLLLFPDAERVVAWLAARLPDQALLDVTQAGDARGGVGWASCPEGGVAFAQTSFAS
jgi:hypothetical protein